MNNTKKVTISKGCEKSHPLKNKIMKKKEKEDLRKNPDKVDTSMGRKYFKEGRVVILENRFYNNSNK